MLDVSAKLDVCYKRKNVILLEFEISWEAEIATWQHEHPYVILLGKVSLSNKTFKAVYSLFSVILQDSWLRKLQFPNVYRCILSKILSNNQKLYISASLKKQICKNTLTEETMWIN